MDRDSLYSNILNDNQNERHETFFSESVNNEFNINDYSGGLQQQADVIQPNSCDCANCSPAIDINLPMTYDDTVVTADHSEQQSLTSQHINHNVNEPVTSTAPQNSMPQDIDTTQYSSLPSPMYINEQASQYSPMQQYACKNDNNTQHRQQSISTRDDSRVNSSRGTEICKFVLPSGLEIIFRHPYLSSLEQNERTRQSQLNKQSHARKVKDRGHPYPTVQNRRHNNRDHVVNSSPQQRHNSCSNSCCSGQPNHFSNVNGGSSLNVVDMQDTRVNQSDDTQTQPHFH
jgi:hypothetical protein